MFLLKICRSPGRGGYFSVSLVSGLVCNSKLLCDVQSLSLTSGMALPHGPPRQEWSRDLLWQTCGQQQGVSLLSGSFRNQLTAVNSFPSAPRQCAREKVLQRGTKQPLTNGWLATGGLWGNGASHVFARVTEIGYHRWEFEPQGLCRQLHPGLYFLNCKM